MLKWYTVKGTFYIEPTLLIEAESEGDALDKATSVMQDAVVEYELDGNQKFVDEVAVRIIATSAMENE